ncbi:MAG: carbohydrate-binding domain-containing protein, partial [Planctomycetota bacterium]
MSGFKRAAAAVQLTFECEALERRALLTASTLFQITDGGDLPLPDFDAQAYADYLRAFESGAHHHGHDHGNGNQGDGPFVEPFALDPFGGGSGCNCPMCRAAAAFGSSQGESSADGESPVWDSYDLDQTFSLNSLEGADHTVYLDFDGHTTTGTYWNSSFNSNNPIETPAYNFSGDSNSFSDSELARIQRVWARVAEDFAPFNVNVTTEDPGEDALRRSGAGDTQWGVRVVIGANTFYSSAGGVAYVGSFDWSTDTPVFVFNTSELGVSEAASHEVGHALGLRHDGLTTGASYYTGHGSGATSWAPIMGVSYSRSVSQWSKGEYANADRQEDDLQIITTGNGFGYRADDYGDSLATATGLLTAGDTAFDTTFGIIEQNTDTDYFSFYAGAGDATINIDPLAFGANLDILANLYDSTGSLVATSNPTEALNASFDLVLPSEGEYFLSITGTGLGDPQGTGYSDYGSLGNYRVTGAVTRYTVDDNIEIRAAGATNQEQMLLQIDGVTVATFDNIGGDASGGVFETYTFRAPGVTPDQIRLVFTNDDDPVTGSRELRIDSVKIDDVVYQSEHATVFSTGYGPSGVAGFNETEYLHTNGYMQFADPSVSPTGIIIRAAGTTNEEQMLLQVDGVTVATFDNVGGDADAGVFETFTYDVAGVLPQQVRIVFTNDGEAAAGGDR